MCQVKPMLIQNVLLPALCLWCDVQDTVSLAATSFEFAAEQSRALLFSCILDQETFYQLL